MTDILLIHHCFKINGSVAFNFLKNNSKLKKFVLTQIHLKKNTKFNLYGVRTFYFFLYF